MLSVLCLVWTCSDAVRQWNSEAGTADRAGREYIYIYIYTLWWKGISFHSRHKPEALTYTSNRGCCGTRIEYE